MTYPQPYNLGHIRTDRGEFKDAGNQVFDVTNPQFAGGAIGDGSTDATRVADNTRAVRLAISALLAAGHGTLLFPDGDFALDISASSIFSVTGSMSCRGINRATTTLRFVGTPTAAAKAFDISGNGTDIHFSDMQIIGPADVAGYEVDGIYLNTTGGRLHLERVDVDSGWNLVIWAVAGSNTIILDDVNIDGMPANPNTVGGAHVFCASDTDVENTLIVRGGLYTGYGKASSNLYHAFYLNEGTNFFIGAGVRFSDAVATHSGAAVQVYGGAGTPMFQIVESAVMSGPGRGLLLHYAADLGVPIQVRGGVIDMVDTGLTARGCVVDAYGVDFQDNNGTSAIIVGTTVAASVYASRCRFQNHASVVDNSNQAGSRFVAHACTFAGAPISTIDTDAGTSTYLDDECEVSGRLPKAQDTITDGDTSPNVFGLFFLKTGNTNPTTIAALDNGQAGQEVLILINDNNTTIDFTGTSLKGNGGSDWTPASGDHMKCYFTGSTWYCDVSDNTA